MVGATCPIPQGCARTTGGNWREWSRTGCGSSVRSPNCPAKTPRRRRWWPRWLFHRLS